MAGGSWEKGERIESEQAWRFESCKAEKIRLVGPLVSGLKV